MMNAVRFLIFVLMELVLIPLFIPAMILFTFRLWRYNITKGISGTAYEPFMARMVMDVAGTREDEAAVRIAPHLPALSPFIVRAFCAIGLPSRWSGHRGAMFAFPADRPSTIMAIMAHRSDFYDRLLADAADPNGEHPAKQIMILGAGWDTRFYGSLGEAAMRFNVRCFEVDQPPTVRAKRAALAREGLSADHVTFVETDFNQRSWFQAATEAGFDPALPTFILWEGVTMYLDDEAVEATLRQVARLASGSRVAFDFFSRELVQAEAPFRLLGSYAKMGVKLFFGEQLFFGISTQAPAREQVRALVSSFGLELGEHEPMGEERGRKVPFGGVALAVCRDESARSAV